jgi:hypothetical protein
LSNGKWWSGLQNRLPHSELENRRAGVPAARTHPFHLSVRDRPLSL